MGRLTGGREFVRVVRGHYVEAWWANDLLTRCAAVVRAVPGAVVSHWTALELVQAPVPLGHSGTLHVSVPHDLDRRVSGVRVHRLLDMPVPVPGAVPVSGPGRAWCDAAALLVPSPAAASRRAASTGSSRPLPRAGDLPDLVAAADVLLRRDPALRGLIRQHLGMHPGERGTAAARRALALVDPRAESAQESRLRVLLMVGGLAPPAVQHEVRTAAGIFVARVDLAYPAQRVAVEYDGEHHRSRDQWRRDLARRERLESMGWRIIAVTAADLRNPDVLLARVARALRQAAAA